ncbi:MAG: hypothetical protein ACE5IR_06015 [bacterium]
MSEEKKSNKGCLIALGVVGGFLVLLAIAMIFLFFKAKDFVEDFASGAGVSEEMISQAQSLNRDYPFQPPADNVIEEARIQTFIRVKKTFASEFNNYADDFEHLKEAANRKDFDFKKYAEALKIMGDLRRDFLEALEEHRMSPREYRFLSKQIYQAYFTDMASGLVAMAKGMGANRGDIIDLEDQIDEIPQENRDLFDKYRFELREVNTFGFELWGLSAGEEK